MANQKEMRTVRETLINFFNEIEIPNFTVEGQTKEGILLHNTEFDCYAVIKPIVKKEDFDPEDALAEYEEKLQAQLEREKAKEEKAKKRKKDSEKED